VAVPNLADSHWFCVARRRYGVLSTTLSFMPQDWEPKDWAEEQAHRVAQEVRRLRGKRSTQWLSDRTAELGYRVSRSVVADLENGRRRYVTTAELIVLALALKTAPIALMYPAPYWDSIQVFPGGESPEVSKMWAAQWFSGSTDLDLDVVRMPLIDQQNYQSHLLALARARKAFALDERKQELVARLALRRRAKRSGDAEVTDEEIDEMIADITDLEGRIEELKRLGGTDPAAEVFVQMMDGRESAR
jgi:hypothetical protein